jgi:hypothetical protein
LNADFSCLSSLKLPSWLDSSFMIMYEAFGSASSPKKLS